MNLPAVNGQGDSFLFPDQKPHQRTNQLYFLTISAIIAGEKPLACKNL